MTDALLTTTSDLARALRRIRDARKRYTLYADYYDGNHPLAFATAKFVGAFGTLFKEFADNLCPSVVDAVADRLELTGFGVEQGRQEQGAAAWAIWQANRMDRRAGEVHLEALKKGDAYVSIWPDDTGQPVIWTEVAEQIAVQYDADRPGRVRWAAKAWSEDDGTARLNLYYPDRIEKYVTAGRRYAKALPVSEAAFEPYRVPDEPWPLPNPWGMVPIFHFATNAPIGKPGVSELRNVKPLQDALNKAVADMLVAMEFAAYRQRWATGIEVPIDPLTGKPIVPFQPGADRVWAVANPDATFGTFEQSDLGQFLKVQDGFRFEIARVSSTPLHHMALISDPPSGEALKTLEAKFVKKVRDRQTAFGNVWEDCFALALRMADRGSERTRLSAEWADAAPKSEREAAEVALLKKQVGVDLEQLLGELGYGAADIVRMLAARAPVAQPPPPVAGV